MEVRLATVEDLKPISVIWADMVREENGEGATPDIPAWLRIFEVRMMTNEYFTMLVVENGNGIVGYISGEVYPEPSDGRIHGLSQSIYVKSEYRGGRVGMHLYHNLARTFVEQGAEVIEFLCKPGKIEFWNKKGYRCSATVMAMDARKLRVAYGMGG